MTNNENLPSELAEKSGAARAFEILAVPFKRIAYSFAGMKHTGLAFLLPVLVMALIYVAIEVFPFGENSVLVLDLNGQYVYYFEAIRDILRGEQGIVYSFERALGGEFLGIVAYYLASPFSIITALFPEGMITESLFVMLLLKCGLSGFNMCVYLHKSHPTKPVNEVIFSVFYALTSYAVVMQHNTMWFDCVLFFPLILLGMESLIKEGKFKLYTLTLAVAVFSNYYIGYMVCIGVAFFFFVTYAMMTPEERNPLGERFHFPKTLVRMGIYSAIAIGMACLIIMPAYYSLSFGKSTFTNPNFSFKQKFDFLDMVTKLFPASYDTVRREGLPFIYSGLLSLIMMIVFFFTKAVPTRKKIGYGLLVAFFVFSFNGSTIDIFWHGMQEPNWLNYRYSFMLSFVMIVMAYRAFEHIETLDFRKVAGTGAALIVLLLIIQKFEYEHVHDLMVVWFSIGCIAIYMILLSGCQKRWLEGSISAILCVFVLLELFCSGLADIVSLDNDVTYSTRTSYRTFIDKWQPAADYVNANDDSFFRMEKTKHRKTNDNFTLNMNGLSNSTSTLNKEQVTFLQQLGYSSKSHWSKYLGGTPLADSLLGVKYLLAESEETVNPLWGEPMMIDDINKTTVYKNEYALSLGYMVSPDIATVMMADEESPFERMNNMVTAMLGSEERIEIFKPYKGLKAETSNLELNFKSGHKEYSKNISDAPGTVTYSFTPENNYEIYMYIPAQSYYAANYQVDVSVNGEKISDYLANETHRILSLGARPEGEPLTVELKLKHAKVYFKNIPNYFYYLDEELFREVMPDLQKYNYEIEKHTDSSFSGTITVPEDRTAFMLTVPYDEGWKIYVDGELAQMYKVLDCLIAVDIAPGKHEITMKYAPWCVSYGVATSAVSTGCFVLMVGFEHLFARKRRKNEAENVPET